ncbi:hypothetical protein ACOSQ4_005500 [Xanthoceras sorbifolium]
MGSISMAETASHFFKVILPQTLEDKKLSIPEKFVRKFGDELSTVATVRVPNGCVWHVGLMKDGRRVWFSDGWHEFLMHHSVSVGYFLVFKYDRSSNFHVLIFDMTACEIVYPCTGGNVENDKQDSAGKMVVRTPNPPVCSLKKNRGCDSCCPLSCGKMYKAPFGSTSGNKKRRACVASSKSPKFKHGYAYESREKKCKIEELVEINESEAVKESSCGVGDGNQTEVLAAEAEFLVSLQDMGIYVARNFGFVSAQEREKTINVVSLFESKKNPSFMAIIRQRHIQKCSLYVPAKFTDKYLRRNSIYIIKLVDSDGKEWPVRIKGRLAGGSELTKGWCTFVKDKKLETGDILVFELIRKEDILLKVSVFHSTIVLDTSN